MLRLDTLKNLYEKLMEIDLLQGKIQLFDEKIEIVFHKDYVLSIKLNIYYNVFIDNILCCKNIEDQDIWEVLHGYFDEHKIYVEHCSISGKRKISELDRKQYERQKEKFMYKSNIKIYTTKELIYQN